MDQVNGVMPTSSGERRNAATLFVYDYTPQQQSILSHSQITVTLALPNSNVPELNTTADNPKVLFRRERAADTNGTNGICPVTVDVSATAAPVGQIPVALPNNVPVFKDQIRGSRNSQEEQRAQRRAPMGRDVQVEDSVDTTFNEEERGHHNYPPTNEPKWSRNEDD